jgi:hypothetical protein
MSYRSNLEAGIHPATDPRRSPELRAELERLAQALTPRWKPGRDRDDFGSALVRIGARLAEQSTLRLDASARRDALAFFDFLGLAPSPPRPATGILVLVLDPKQVTPIHAPARTQVTVASTGGRQEPFETQSRLRLVPGGIVDLYSVDAVNDRIDQAPALVTAAMPPLSPVVNYRLLTFAGVGGKTVQLSPATGLEPHDLLQIDRHKAVYRVASVEKNGLVNLLDPLEEATDTQAPVTRTTAFRAFNLRDVQRHEFLIGHQDLLNVDQPAIITLDLVPSLLAHQLGELEVDFALYGTQRGQKVPDWHPLKLEGQANGSGLRLRKTWHGSVDKAKVNGQENRWIRARLSTPIEDRDSPTMRADEIQLTVESTSAESGPIEEASERQSRAANGEHSQTVPHAAHNGTPLTTTGRFHPFGPEPVRFDTFALASPEALSKSGAEVTLAFTMADSSMKSFGVATAKDPSADKRWHGFGVGTTGELQAIFPDEERVRWVPVISNDGRRIKVGEITPVALNLGDQNHLVVVGDAGGGLWGGVVRCEGDPPTATVLGNWHRIERSRESGATSRGAFLVMPAPHAAQNTAAVILEVCDGEILARRLGEDAAPLSGDWTAIKSASDAARPNLTSAGQITPVQGSAYPQVPDRLDVVVRDAEGILWYGRLADADAGEFPNTGGVGVAWTKLGHIEDEGQSSPKEVPRARHDVVPAATWYRNARGKERLSIAFAPRESASFQEGSSAQGLGGFDVVAREHDGSVKPAELWESAGPSPAPGSTLHTHPGVPGFDARPVVIGLDPDRKAILIWEGEPQLRTMPVNEEVSAAGPLLVLTSSESGGTSAEILVPVRGERLFRRPMPLNIPYELHNQYVLRGRESQFRTYRLEIFPSSTDPDGDPSERPIMVTLNANNCKIFEEKPDPDSDLNRRVYAVDDPAFKIGRIFRFLKLHNDGFPFSGTFASAENRRELTLQEGDTFSKENLQVVIADESYAIEAVHDGVATLDRPVTGADGADDESVEYYAVAHWSAKRPVSRWQLGTLAQLQTTEVPDQLRFGAPASPEVQGIAPRAENDENSVWVQLAEPWQVRPPDGAAARVTSKSAWTVDYRPHEYRNPELSWEYFDGKAWQHLITRFIDKTQHLSVSGAISFEVPDDLKPTEIGGKESYWIRARLVGGDYGRPIYRVREEERKPDGIKIQSVVVDASELNPPEVLSVAASFSGPHKVHPETILVENNGDLLDQTQAATAPWASFALFEGAKVLSPDADRALIVGLTGSVGAGPLTIFADAEDQPGTGTLQVDVLTAEGWQRVAVDDGTASLRRAGLITVSLDDSPAVLRLFGQDRVWLRFRDGAAPDARAGQGGPDDETWAPVVRSLLPNAVRIHHAKTMGMEILGSSQGEPGTTVYLSSVPVLPDSTEIRVREDLSEEERTALEERHRARARTPMDADRDLVRTDVRGAPGSWVLWQRVDSLIGQDRDARVYVLDPRTGRVAFGDDRTGRIPPAGRDGIRCFSYQQGGGAAGNVPARAETKLTGAVAGVEAAILPLGTAGGSDSPPADALFATAPQQLRHTGYAVTPADIENLAVASSSDVLRARCRRPNGPRAPLQVAVVVRDPASRHPEPTHAQREAIAAFIRARGWGGLDVDIVQVGGPTYVPVAVNVQLIAPPESWTEAEHAAKERLVAFFDPEHGGPHGTGWEFARWPAQSDVLRLLRQLPGLDRIAAVHITGPDGTQAAELAPDGMVCAEPAHITVTARAEGREP